MKMRVHRDQTEVFWFSASASMRRRKVSARASSVFVGASRLVKGLTGVSSSTMMGAVLHLDKSDVECVIMIIITSNATSLRTTDITQQRNGAEWRGG